MHSGEQELLVLVDRLYAAALRLAHNACDAEDLVQETCVRAVQNLRQVRDESRIEAWLFRVLHNVFLNSVRDRPPEIVSFEDAAARSGGSARQLRASQPPEPPQALFASMLSDELDSALRRLPEEYREAVWLADVEEFSYAEISRIMDCPVGTVRSRIARGRMMLLESLQATQADAQRGRVGGA